MGMAASQARLLTITARLHDVEYQAQSIQNAKISLATQQDDVYQKYLDALDATTLTRQPDLAYLGLQRQQTGKRGVAAHGAPAKAWRQYGHGCVGNKVSLSA